LKPDERDNLLYLEDIVLAMARIQEYISGFDFQNFKRDYKTVDAVVRNFEIIGEASKNLSTEIKNKNTHVPWEEMYRLRIEYLMSTLELTMKLSGTLPLDICLRIMKMLK
jgi:uncharacterized protein with HEPN domain